jgi:hypothetical protein
MSRSRHFVLAGVVGVTAALVPHAAAAGSIGGESDPVGASGQGRVLLIYNCERGRYKPRRVIVTCADANSACEASGGRAGRGERRGAEGPRWLTTATPTAPRAPSGATGCGPSDRGSLGGVSRGPCSRGSAGVFPRGSLGTRHGLAGPGWSVLQLGPSRDLPERENEGGTGVRARAPMTKETPAREAFFSC